MVELKAEEVFRTVKYAGEYGLLDSLPTPQAKQGPGLRFFESFQRNLLDMVDLEKLDQALFYLAPAIHFMSEKEHWESADFTSTEMFLAVKHLQEMGVFEISKKKLQIPGAGDRFFEFYQRVFIEKIGVEKMEHLLHTLGQCICFLASEEAMVNVKESRKGEKNE